MIRYCFEHKIGWYMHERDEKCRGKLTEERYPDTPEADLPGKERARKMHRARDKMRKLTQNKMRRVARNK